MSVKEVTLSPNLKPIMENHASFLDRSEIPVRDKCYEEAFAQHPDEPACIRFAYGFSNFLKKKKILLNIYDVLAGFAYRYSYNTTMPIDFPRDYDPRFRPPRMISQKKQTEMCMDFYHVDENCKEIQEFSFFEAAIKGGLYKHWESGHIIPGYDRIIQKGFGGIIAECDEKLRTASSKEKPFVESMRMCAQAATDYILRYHNKAEFLLKNTTNEQYRKQLTRISNACLNISTKPASSFFEAVQLLWLTHELMYNENIPTSISLGRVDQYLNPYYEKDKAAGIINYDSASELIDAFWIKCSTTIHAYQNVTLGGTDAAGNYMANDLTYICLQATRKLRNDQPLLSLRYSPNIPQDLWDESVALLKLGLGFPAFFSDENTIKARIAAGLSPEDAQNYGIIGCVEPCAPGAEYSKTEILRVNWTKILELMLQQKNLYGSDQKLEPLEKKDLSTIKDFDSFYTWYKNELLTYTRRAMDIINYMDTPWPYYYPTPALSMTMADCIQNGMDVTGGGTTYNNSGVNAAGMANAVDSLAAIRKAVFEDKVVSLQELAQAMAVNFKGYEKLHYYLKNKCPKYGNDDDSVDALMADLVDSYAKMTSAVTNPRGGIWQLGLYSVEDHAKLGILTGATPDGRLEGVSLANAICPVQGADHIGPTAVINSLLKTDLSIATNHMVLDLKFNPVFFEKPTHINALKMLINSYFKRGGLEIQFNVIDAKTLLEAQAHPQEHQNLVVRVSGFSAYFVTLGETTQNEIIARTEYSTI